MWLYFGEILEHHILLIELRLFLGRGQLVVLKHDEWFVILPVVLIHSVASPMWPAGASIAVAMRGLTGDTGLNGRLGCHTVPLCKLRLRKSSKRAKTNQ